MIEDFNKRKQPIYFYQPCANVVSVFKGAIEEFVNVCSQEELDFLLVGKNDAGKEEYGLNMDDVKEASRLLSGA